MIVMGIYRRSNTNKQREGNLLNIFVLEKNLKSYLITLYLETTNKIIRIRIYHPSLLLSFFSSFVIFPLFLSTILLSPLCHFPSFIIILFFFFWSFLTSSLSSPSPLCFVTFSSLFYQSFFTFFSKYVLFIHY